MQAGIFNYKEAPWGEVFLFVFYEKLLELHDRSSLPKQFDRGGNIGQI